MAAAGGSAVTVGQRARWTLGAMCGRSNAMERLFLQMRYLSGHLRIASIEGEAGTGKLLAARTLHQLRGPSAGPFVSCPANRFFTERASADRLAEAAGGTLYLSHLEALEPELQGNLLHLLGWMRQHAAHPHGSLAPGKAALSQGEHAPRVLLVGTGRALRPLMLHGKLRSDLYHQLSAVQLSLPPLRERREDIAMLAERFVADVSTQYGKPVQGLAEDVLPVLLGYLWPGNVGELEVAVTRAALRARQPWLGRKDFHLPELAGAAEATAEKRGREHGSKQRPQPTPGQHPKTLPGQRLEAAGEGSGEVSRQAPGQSSGYPPTVGTGRGPSAFGLHPGRQGKDAQHGNTAAATGRSATPHAEGVVAWPGPLYSVPMPVPMAGRAAQRTAGLQGVSRRIAPSDHLHRARPGQSAPYPEGSERAGGASPAAVSPGAGGSSSSLGRQSAPHGEGACPQLDANLDRAILRHIRVVLASVHGNKLRAARLLGISRSTLYRLLETAIAGGNAVS